VAAAPQVCRPSVSWRRWTGGGSLLVTAQTHAGFHIIEQRREVPLTRASAGRIFSGSRKNRRSSIATAKISPPWLQFDGWSEDDRLSNSKRREGERHGWAARSAASEDCEQSGALGRLQS
jgi:hypothetical protein